MPIAAKAFDIAEYLRTDTDISEFLQKVADARSNSADSIPQTREGEAKTRAVKTTW